MRSKTLQFWTVRLTTFVVWALVAGGTVFWVLQNKEIGAGALQLDGAGLAAGTGFAQAPDLTPQVAMALGAKNSVAPTAAGALAAMQARLQLLGVLAVGTNNGAALIAIDGKPAKPYRVGAVLEDNLHVISVVSRSASIGTNNAIVFTLELPGKDYKKE